MHIHILGICGTFMGGVARIAVEQGYKVTGSDANVYPPMSDQLRELGIDISHGWDPSQFDANPDIVVIGNALSRGNPAVEFVLDHNFDYMSGPEFMSRYVLKHKWVIAVSGTHGKTTTTSMLAWILEYAGMNPGFLIGGVAENFELSARNGESDFFVIEADEYDTAFFDKRSKFVHYHPRTLVINNLEFDHADIFDSLSDIQKQFNHLIRTVPSSGKIIYSSDYEPVKETLERGCWSQSESFSISCNQQSEWFITSHTDDYSSFLVQFDDNKQVNVNWHLIGAHNASNAIAAIAAARHVGIDPSVSSEALSTFKSVKRRLEKLGVFAGITVFDDFAHHPTAIDLTLSALRANVGRSRIFAIIEPRSNTMKLGVHKNELSKSLSKADFVLAFDPGNLDWSLQDSLSALSDKCSIYTTIDEIIFDVVAMVEPDDQVLIMSNGSFLGLYPKLCDALDKR